MSSWQWRDAFTGLLIAFGITAPAGAFLSGAFLAVAGAYLASLPLPRRTVGDSVVTFTTALFIALLLAILHDHLFPAIPIQFKMGVGGFMARFIVAFSTGFGSTMVSRADEFANGVTIPGWLKNLGGSNK